MVGKGPVWEEQFMFRDCVGRGGKEVRVKARLVIRRGPLSFRQGKHWGSPPANCRGEEPCWWQMDQVVPEKAGRGLADPGGPLWSPVLCFSSRALAKPTCPLPSLFFRLEAF